MASVKVGGGFVLGMVKTAFLEPEGATLEACLGAVFSPVEAPCSVDLDCLSYHFISTEQILV